MILKMNHIFHIFLNFTAFAKLAKLYSKKLKFQNYLKFDSNIVQHQSTRRLKGQIWYFFAIKFLLTISQHLRIFFFTRTFRRRSWNGFSQLHFSGSRRRKKTFESALESWDLIFFVSKNFEIIFTPFCNLKRYFGPLIIALLSQFSWFGGFWQSARFCQQ